MRTGDQGGRGVGGARGARPGVLHPGLGARGSRRAREGDVFGARARDLPRARQPRLGCHRAQQHGHVRVLPREVGRGHRPLPAGSRHADQDRRHRRCGDGADERRRDPLRPRTPGRGRGDVPRGPPDLDGRRPQGVHRADDQRPGPGRVPGGRMFVAMELYGEALRMFQEIGDDGEILETEARTPSAGCSRATSSRRWPPATRRCSVPGRSAAWLRRSRCSTASGVGPSCRRGGRTTRGGLSGRTCGPRARDRPTSRSRWRCTPWPRSPGRPGRPTRTRNARAEPCSNGWASFASPASLTSKASGAGRVGPG